MKQLMFLILLFISSISYSQLIISNHVALHDINASQVLTEKYENNIFIFSDSYITVKYATQLTDTYAVVSKDEEDNTYTYKTVDKNGEVVYFFLSAGSIGIMPQRYISRNYLLIFRI